MSAPTATGFTCPEDEKDLHDLLTLPYGKYLYLYCHLQRGRDIIFYGMGPSDPGNDWSQIKYCKNMYVLDPTGKAREEYALAEQESRKLQEESRELLDICKLVEEMCRRAHESSI